MPMYGTILLESLVSPLFIKIKNEPDLDEKLCFNYSYTPTPPPYTHTYKELNSFKSCRQLKNVYYLLDRKN